MEGTMVRVMPDGSIEGYLTAFEFAQKMHVNQSLVYIWLQHGKIKSLNVGGLHFIREDEAYPPSMKTGPRLRQRYVFEGEREFMNGFMDRLNRALTDNGLTQSKFCEMLDITSGSISSWRSGMSIPRLETAVKIAKTLNVSLDWLCGLDGEEEEVK